MPPRTSTRRLTPEEEAIGDPDEDDDEIDDTLPADLWFRRRIGRTTGPACPR